MYRGNCVDELKLEILQDETYDFIIENLNHWFGGRNMTDMLPRLFFKHFGNTSFIAKINNEIVGFIIAFFSASDMETGYIHFVGVNPNYRRLGVGKKLYQHFYKLCKEKSVTKISCITSPINETSITYHHSLGFSASKYKTDGQVDPELNYDGPGNHRILFKKNISN